MAPWKIPRCVSNGDPAVVIVSGRPVPITNHHIVRDAWLASTGHGDEAVVSVSPDCTVPAVLSTVASSVPRNNGLGDAKSSLADADPANVRRNSSGTSAARARRPCIRAAYATPRVRPAPPRCPPSPHEAVLRPSRRGRPDPDAELGRGGRGLPARGHAELRQYRGDVVVDRLRRDDELP